MAQSALRDISPTWWKDIKPQASQEQGSILSQFTSLDTPENMSLGATVADMLMGFAPGIGTAQGIRDFERARRDDDTLGMVLGGVGAIPFAGGVVKAARTVGKASKAAGKIGYNPDAIANAYPATGPGSMNYSNPAKPEGFMQKQATSEELALQKARNAAQKDILLGNYDPFFPVEQRYYANPSNYNIQGNTLTDAIPARADTIAKYEARFDTPEIRQSLKDAYAKGLSPSSIDWYAMGQLEDEFIKELGPEIGPMMFRQRFAESMASTTGGADPTSNLLMANYVNFQKEAGNPLPQGSWNYPHPIGGRYLSGNMAMADKVMMQGNPLTATDQSKRFNFMSNFLGDRSRATIDEQMSGLFESGLTAPPGASYGIMEKVLGSVGDEIGVMPANAQDVMWAGAKGVEGKPMIQIFNEAVERTARVTGKSRREVVREFILAKSPLYGIGGAAILGGVASSQDQQEQAQ
jgi:hypothetical protein